MARVTVEDCIDKIPNRFDLVLVAAGRAKALSAGAPLTVERGDEKNTVLALREIEEENIDLNDIRENIISGMQRFAKAKENTSDSEELKEVESEIMGSPDSSIYSDTEFVASDSFQVVDDINS